MTVYALVVAKGGPKIHPVTDAAEQRAVVSPAFRGDLQDLADVIGVQLSIPTPSLTADPSRPNIAAGPPVPVVDSTGLSSGVYELTLDLKPEADTNAFIIWQRFLLDQCGLKLESRKSPIPILIVDRTMFASPN
jgi:uncharacterized protein (TIGR03435 family)